MRQDKSTSILIIDDNPGIAKFLRLNLEKAGYGVTVVSDLVMAEEIGSAVSFDAVALASSAPGLLSGAVSNLRHDLSCPILLYGPEIQAEEDMRLLGADAWVGQFFEPCALSAAIAEILNKKP